MPRKNYPQRRKPKRPTKKINKPGYRKKKPAYGGDQSDYEYGF